MIDHQIVGDTHGPRQKFTFLVISAHFKGVNDLNECLLKDIFSDHPITHLHVDEAIDLILVNRIFDLTGEEGLNFIRDHLAGPAKLIPVILISNYADAQESAVALGARRGFGKAALNSPETEKILREFLS